MKTPRLDDPSLRVEVSQNSETVDTFERHNIKNTGSSAGKAFSTDIIQTELKAGKKNWNKQHLFCVCFVETVAIKSNITDIIIYSKKSKVSDTVCILPDETGNIYIYIHMFFNTYEASGTA